MKIISLFFTFFLLQSLSAQENLLNEFQKKWENAAAYTLEVAELMPEEYYSYKPTEDQMTFEAQLIHILRNMTWLSTAYLTEKKYEVDWEKDYSKAELLDLIQQTYAFAGTAAAGLTTKQLEEEVKFFAGPMSKRQILTLMNDHSTHHRGQLMVYIRLKDVTPPKYRGW